MKIRDEDMFVGVPYELIPNIAENMERMKSNI